ncbi:N-acylglucosamine 2-epimerase [Nocardioides sp. Soil774]|uniref:thioredoxin domain-containing protein n=1 Tax=Nocardioides sp. Soil774 TaxID=1736408 RepID=UPI0006FB4AE5|nr:thioredoxin domain-containing protein [Nocardioides sp. Soil774]KRE93466.1 N-acylglucosamine 2-epimerase [Nocardioides sp. Soil774]
MNRLRAATSPYLLQHADNPVDWWEWGSEAFEEARRRGVPVLLSVGYAACHWCHVMAHESFEDAATAAQMNEQFVSIKVDREERPDVDAIYMQATTAMTGHGGWPMTVVLDHDANPWFAGTYFPDTPRHGQASFRQVLQAVTDAWRDRRDGVRQQAAQLREHLQAPATLPASPIGADEVDAAIGRLAQDFDAAAGGFGGAPKFPPSMVLELLRRRAARADDEVGRQAAHMLAQTVAAMAGGGIYDQLGGGFARYAVDRGWVVPHFEKMLYDNGQLLALYARLGTPLGDRVAAETADFLLRELGTVEGGFASALDADSEGEEGTFYVWTPAQLVAVLGEDDGAWAADLLAVTDGGTFEHGTSTLQLRHAPDDTSRWASARARLLDARAARVRPARDDKVVAAWNGLAISGLVATWQRLGEQRHLDAAVAAGRLLVDVHLVDGRLRRVSRDGVAGRPDGVVEDLGCVATAFVDLAAATLDATWTDHARALLDDALARFRADDGGFFDTASDAEALVARPRDPSDNASPSGLSSVVHALVAFSALTGDDRHRTAAEEALATAGVLAREAPRFAGWSLAAAEAMLDGPREVAVVGPAGAARDALARAAYDLPGAVVVVADGPRDDWPLLAGRGPVDGQAAAYVCRHHVCAAPVTDPADLR